jgi:hypothetical protein
MRLGRVGDKYEAAGYLIAYNLAVCDARHLLDQEELTVDSRGQSVFGSEVESQ